MKRIMIAIMIISSSIYAMDEYVIDIKDAEVNRQIERRMRFAQEKNKLLRKAEENIGNGLVAFMTGYLWWATLFCVREKQPTLEDSYMLGCSCGAGSVFCLSGCCQCCRAMMLKEE